MLCVGEYFQFDLSSKLGIRFSPASMKESAAVGMWRSATYLYGRSSVTLVFSPMRKRTLVSE